MRIQHYTPPASRLPHTPSHFRPYIALFRCLIPLHSVRSPYAYATLNLSGQAENFRLEGCLLWRISLHFGMQVQWVAYQMLCIRS